MQDQELEYRIQIILLVIGIILFLDIVFKLFNFKFWLFSIFYFLAALLSAPFMLFISASSSEFDRVAFWAMIGYLIIYYAVLFIIGKIMEANQETENQSLPIQEKPREI